MIKPIAIIGIGPSGLAAAHACRLAGVPMSIFSRDDQKSLLGGAQFLHRGLPLINEKENSFKIHYSLVGDSHVYREKVYGNEPVPFVSMDNVQHGQVVTAWSLIDTYEELWNELVETNTLNIEKVHPSLIQGWIEKGFFSAIISSAPRPSVCRSQAGMGYRTHTFVSQRIRILGESVLGNAFDNTIIYDGTPNVSWYRTSRINGIGSTEWGDQWVEKKLPYEGKFMIVRKPIRTDCNCWQSKSIPFLYVGRFGRWEKGELVHMAFDRTVELLIELGAIDAEAS